MKDAFDLPLYISIALAADSSLLNVIVAPPLSSVLEPFSLCRYIHGFLVSLLI